MAAELGAKGKKRNCLACPHCQIKGALRFAWVAKGGDYWLLHVMRCTACGLPSLWRLELMQRTKDEPKEG